MIRTRSSLFVAVAMAFLASTSLAQEFSANHLLVGNSNGRVVEFDANGDFVRVTTVDLDSDGVEGLAFGPDGLLYTLGTSTLRTMTSDGTVDDLAGSFSDNRGALGFGTNGSLYVISGSSMEIMETTGNTSSESLAELTDSRCADLAFGPDGHLFVCGNSSIDPSDEFFNLVEYDASFEVVDTTTMDATDEASVGKLAWGRGGAAYVVEPDAPRVAKVTFENGIVNISNFTANPVLSNPIDCVVGPNGNVFVADSGANAIFEFAASDGSVVDTILDIELSGPQCLAFAPFRYKAEIKGDLSEEGQSASKVKEKGAVLSVTPGSGQIMLSLKDGKDLETAFGTNAWVFSGPEIFEDDDAKERYFHGSTAGWNGIQRGVGTCTLKVGGKAKGDSNFFKVTSAKGPLERAESTTSFSGKVVASKLLN